MKKLLFISAMVVLNYAIFAQKDTATINFGKSKILIISDKSDTSTKTIVLNDSLEQKKQSKKKKFNGRWSGLEIGLNGYMTGDNSFSLPTNIDYLELQQAKSINFNFNFIEWNIGLYKNYIGIVSGLGLGYNNYQFEKHTHLNMDTTFLGYTIDSDNKYKKNKLVVSNLRVPLMLEFNLPVNDHKDKIYISAGMIGSLRIGSHIKQVYFVDGDRQSNKEYHSYFLNPFAYSAQARIGYNKLGFYFEYQLSELFKKDKGPSLYPWAAGLSFCF
ncbi:MAG TPA: outer membrane beta-barrel protein [Bacteroidales bacterium]|nr:outer membrane beta-barrel protein [Bacteroidales bacterium]